MTLNRAVGYQVYIRSFADANGDGVGDLPGITARLEHLAWLGVDLVWITPFYPSPMRDHGYDVQDYCGVAPEFGTLADFDALVTRAHALGLRVLIDLVPNHSSSDHPWFLQARTSRENSYRDYYIWRDPAPDGGPPNNWVAHFGGPAWTLDPRTDQYYLHLFLPEQPDLNWRNPRVADEFDAILRSWIARGVDGFRIDVAHGLMKHPDFPDNPPHPDGLQAKEAGVTTEFGSLLHLYDLNQSDSLDIFRRWRRLVEPSGALLLGEVYLLELDKVMPFIHPRDGLHLSFWFAPLHVPWHPAELRQVLQAPSVEAPGALAFIQGNHDRPRSVTRLGGGRAGRARAKALATLLFGLPGVPFVYQGEELGLEEGRVPPEAIQDPLALRTGTLGRDGARTPMPWEPTAGFGFTSSPKPWLPFGDLRPEDTVAVQRTQPDSTLHFYRRLIAVRRNLPDLTDGPLEWLAEDAQILAYRRGSLFVMAHCGEHAVAFAWSRGQGSCGTVRLATRREREGERVEGTLLLEPAEALIVQAH